MNSCWTLDFAGIALFRVQIAPSAVPCYILPSCLFNELSFGNCSCSLCLLSLNPFSNRLKRVLDWYCWKRSSKNSSSLILFRDPPQHALPPPSSDTNPAQPPRGQLRKRKHVLLDTNGNIPAAIPAS